MIRGKITQVVEVEGLPGRFAVTIEDKDGKRYHLIGCQGEKNPIDTGRLHGIDEPVEKGWYVEVSGRVGEISERNPWAKDTPGQLEELTEPLNGQPGDCIVSEARTLARLGGLGEKANYIKLPDEDEYCVVGPGVPLGSFLRDQGSVETVYR